MSLGEVLGLGEVDEDELYSALDRLLERQPAIEATLAKRHLTHGTLVLYDVSSWKAHCATFTSIGQDSQGQHDADAQPPDCRQPANCLRRTERLLIATLRK